MYLDWYWGTHIFLDYETAKMLGYTVEVIPTISVVVAKGTKIKFSYIWLVFL